MFYSSTIHVLGIDTVGSTRRTHRRPWSAQAAMLQRSHPLCDRDSSEYLQPLRVALEIESLGRCKMHNSTQRTKLHNADSGYFCPRCKSKSAISFNWRGFRVHTGRTCLDRSFAVVCSVPAPRRGHVRRMRHSRTRATDRAETGYMAVRVLGVCVVAWCIVPCCLRWMFMLCDGELSRVVHVECETREAMSIRHRKRILRTRVRATARRVRQCLLHPKPVTPVGLHAGRSVVSLSDCSKNGVANVDL